MKIAIVLLDSLEISCTYDAPEPQQGKWGGEWGSPQFTIHLSIPEGLDFSTVMAIRSETGEIILVEDPAKVAAKTAQAWIDLRTERNHRLSTCDWTQLGDVSVNKAAWTSYRQALRNLPETTQDPLNPVWPAPPL